MRKITRVIIVVSLAVAFSGRSLSTMAQQPANQQAAGGAAPGAGTVVGTDAEHKASITTFQSDTPVAHYDYYRWHDSCYYRDQSGRYAPVPPGYCL